MKEFDVNQGHGDHNDCVRDGDSDDLLSTWIPKAITEGSVIGDSKGAIECDLGEGMPKKMRMQLFGDAKSSLRMALLLAVKESGNESTLVSAYPEFDGCEVKVKLTEIHEWADGVEATLEGEMLGEAARPVAFFDTRYALRKGEYEIGKTYTFRLAAFGYNAQVLPEKDREFRFEGKDAVEHRRRCGEEQEYDESGNPRPVIFRLEEMVAYLPRFGAYPDDAEFQSPVFGDVEEISAFGTSFYRINIGIACEGEDVVVPLIVRKSCFKEVPKSHDPVRGFLWLQGYCVEG